MEQRQLGEKLLCKNCGQTATFQETLPKGWLEIFDYLGTGQTFCSFSCITHYLSSRLESPEVMLVEKPSIFKIEG